MRNDTLFHMMGVDGTRPRNAAGVCDTDLDGWASRARRAGAFADPRDSAEVLTLPRSGIARRPNT